jgi:uncharacterized protein
MFLHIKLHRISKNNIILAILAIFSTVLIILTPLISHSITVQEIPNPRQVNGGWVSDQANILSPATEAQLNKLLWQLKTNTGAEFAVVTVPNTSSASSPKEFTTELFNYWGIGEKGKDNGLLWLHSVGDRRVERETGYGLEGILPDARLGNIIRTEVIPKFKAGDFNGGTLIGVQSISKIITNELETSLPGEILPASQPETMLQGENIILLAIAFLLGAIAYYQAQYLAKRPIYVSQTDNSQNKSAQSSSSSLINNSQEKNFGIHFFLWLAGFIISITLLSMISLIIFNQANLLFSGLFSVIIALIPIKILTPQIDQNRQSRSLHPIYCEKCRQPMVKLNDHIIINSLNEHQKTAVKIGSIAFEGWQCENCLNSSPEFNNLEQQDVESQAKKTKKNKFKGRPFHLRRYVLGSYWQMCPVGQELTVKQSSHTSVHPTRYSTGLEIVSQVCQCCDYHNEQHRILPVLPPPSSSSSSSYSSSDSGGSSSGGGDFGGGSSGGGGAGDSY